MTADELRDRPALGQALPDVAQRLDTAGVIPLADEQWAAVAVGGLHVKQVCSVGNRVANVRVQQSTTAAAVQVEAIGIAAFPMGGGADVVGVVVGRLALARQR